MWSGCALSYNLAIYSYWRRNVYIHGFALDKDGRKMSKSLGNVVDPDVIIGGGKNKKGEPAYGIDVLRWFVAYHAAGNTDIKVGTSVVRDCANNISKARSTFKFMLGVLDDFDEKTDVVPYDRLNSLDRFALNRAFNYCSKATDLYESLSYNKIAWNFLKFISNDVSALYCYVVKDR
ncbi:IARS2 (predicted) [Pycnogonum litorale]